MSVLFELSGQSASYQGTAVLRQVDLQIHAGEKVALIGRSGAGKSTLLRLLFERAAGEAAIVPQDFGLVRSLSVFHNVYMARLNKHNAIYNLCNLLRPLGREVAAVAPLLDGLELQEKMFEPAGQLSGGQQQRTAVARALHQDASVIIADEPVSAVDEHQSRKVLDALTERHGTVVLAMHDTTLALEYTDRVIGIANGRVSLDCPTRGLASRDLEELYSDPASSVQLNR